MPTSNDGLNSKMEAIVLLLWSATKISIIYSSKFLFMITLHSNI